MTYEQFSRLVFYNADSNTVHRYSNHKHYPAYCKEHGIAPNQVPALGQGVALVPELDLQSSLELVGEHEARWQEMEDLKNHPERYFDPLNPDPTAYENYCALCSFNDVVPRPK